MMAYKVLHVIRRLDVVGGAERLVSELVRYSPEHDVLIFDGAECFFDLGEREVIRAQGFLRAMWLCMKLRRNYDIIHLHLFPAIYLSLALGKRSIIHEHNTHNARRDLKVFWLIERWVYRRAKSVVAISMAAKEALRAWVGAGPKIFVLENFAPKQPPREPKPKSHNGSATKRLLMVASFTEQKRHDLVIRALATLPYEYELAFAGTGPKLTECKNLVKKLGLDLRVSFYGAVKDVGALYDQADLCILASHWEGFGLVVLEAAQYGVPSLVSNVPGLRDICPHESLLFTGKSPEDLGAHIQELLSVQDGLPMSRQQLEAYAASFGFEKYMKRLEDCYAG